jgi:hypothetical protein
VIQDEIMEAITSMGMMGGMQNVMDDKETMIDDKPTKPAKLLMEWPNALTKLADDDEKILDIEAHSLQQLLASVFDGLWI